MGMFDYVYVDVDLLPLTQEEKLEVYDGNNHEWQTKDLDCNLDAIFIKGDGVFKRCFDPDEPIDEIIRVEGLENKCIEFYGYLKEDIKKNEFNEKTGNFICTNEDEVKGDMWIEFLANFDKNGKLNSIKCENKHKRRI